jgi:protein TonB
MIEPYKPMCKWSCGTAISMCFHVLVIGLVCFIGFRVPSIRAVKQAGSASGTHLLLTYSTGGVPSKGTAIVKSLATPASKVQASKKPMAIPKLAVPMSQSEQGNGSTGLSGLGAGDMTYALLVNHPRPEPNLSSLPRGKGGSIILNAVIDTQGGISALTVLQSLSASIDEQVLATVRTWNFKPATMNGQPVVSEQEIVFHYERS